MAEAPGRVRDPWGSAWLRLVWAVAILILRGIFSLSTRLRVVGAGRVPHGAPLLLVSNHASHFDPPLIGMALPRPVDWMAMVELYSRGWSRRLFEALNTVPVRRGRPDRAALRDAAARLAAGRMVGIFPEGGIRDSAASLLAEGRPRRGAALLARMSGAAVLPCVVLGSDRLYNYRHWLPWRRAPVWVAFGEPYVPPRDDDRFADELVARLHALRDELMACHGAAPADLPRPPRERMSAAAPPR